MNEGQEIINIERDDGGPVIINNEAGAIVTVNVNTRNTYTYNCPPWLANEDAVARIIGKIKGE